MTKTGFLGPNRSHANRSHVVAAHSGEPGHAGWPHALVNKRQSSRDGESCQPRRRARVLRTASRRAPPSPMTAPAMRSAWMRSSGSPSGEALWWGRSAGVGCSVSGTSGCTAYCPPVHLRASRNRPRHWCSRTRCGADCSVVGNGTWLSCPDSVARSINRARGGLSGRADANQTSSCPPHAPTAPADADCAARGRRSPRRPPLAELSRPTKDSPLSPR